ncbi:hypothetical protein SAY86_019132 [Trapa natans]|uniref:Uncharacterized protein n=1 Tax=Trapa natans TaxID=22666 RepID=A0AAN7LHK1_TRANT|nr:hypothetical protein SAY86_019132 [Trapa natans]
MDVDHQSAPTHHPYLKMFDSSKMGGATGGGGGGGGGGEQLQIHRGQVVSDDRANSNGAFPMSEIGTAADSEGLKNLATSGFVTDASNTVMDMISVKDLGLSLQSFQAQKQQEQAALFASPTGSLSTGSAVGGRYSRMPDELSFNRPPPPQQPTVGINGAAAGGCYFQQRGTLQSSLSTPVHEHSFNFGDRFTSEGFPGFCLSSQFHSEEGSNSNPI